jgi:hypothetical protein
MCGYFGRYQALIKEVEDLRDWGCEVRGGFDTAASRQVALKMAVGDVTEVLEAANISLRLLQQSREGVQTEMARLRDECTAILIVCDVGCLPESAINVPDPALTASLEELRSERSRLLRDIEAEYAQAVVTQSVCDVRSDTSQRHTTVVLDAGLADRRLLAALEAEARELQEDRDLVERSLESCHASLFDCQEGISDRVSMHFYSLCIIFKP